MCNGVMAEPDTSLWSPGLVTDTVLVMVQLNDGRVLKAGVVGGGDRHRVGAGPGGRAADHSGRAGRWTAPGAASDPAE